MKKLLLVAICASAVVAFGDESPVALGQVGVTAVTSSLTNTIVSVSYEDLGGGDVSASNLVKTTNLEIGDHLYVYQGGGSFKAFTLAGDPAGAKYWNGTAVSEPGAPIAAASAAKDVSVVAGTGVWLVRGSNWDGNAFTFYIYGKPAASTSVTVPAGTAMLVGNPNQSGSQSPTITSPNIGDKIVIPYANRVGTRTYDYYGDGWALGMEDPTLSAPAISAGTGFWYIRSGTGSSVTISWP